jgi:cytochrome o ubiquinol oxidase subunit 1
MNGGDEKQQGRTLVERSEYVDIWLPKNSPVGLVIGALAGLFGFSIIWHLWWLTAICIVATIIVVIRRTLIDDNEHHISANELFHEAAKASR